MVILSYIMFIWLFLAVIFMSIDSMEGKDSSFYDNLRDSLGVCILFLLFYVLERPYSIDSFLYEWIF